MLSLLGNITIGAEEDEGAPARADLEGAADLQSSAEERATTAEQKLVLALMEEDEVRGGWAALCPCRADTTRRAPATRQYSPAMVEFTFESRTQLSTV